MTLSVVGNLIINFSFQLTDKQDISYNPVYTRNIPVEQPPADLQLRPARRSIKRGTQKPMQSLISDNKGIQPAGSNYE
jgi:hypothetical protein